jgi:hypothetical protein
MKKTIFLVVAGLTFALVGCSTDNSSDIRQVSSTDAQKAGAAAQPGAPSKIPPSVSANMPAVAPGVGGSGSGGPTPPPPTSGQ